MGRCRPGCSLGVAEGEGPQGGREGRGRREVWWISKGRKNPPKTPCPPCVSAWGVFKILSGGRGAGPFVAAGATVALRPARPADSVSFDDDVRVLSSPVIIAPDQERPPSADSLPIRSSSWSRFRLEKRRYSITRCRQGGYFYRPLFGQIRRKSRMPEIRSLP